MVHRARVDYTPGALSLFIDDMNAAVLASAIDLSSLLSLDSGMAYVGFTAGTGGGYENHDILSWNHQSIPEPISAALVLLALGVMSQTKRRQL